jgi:mono/diheme cytochrome c family protein
MKTKIISGISGLLLLLFFSCQSDQQLEFIHYYSAGSVVYQGHCQNCHGKNGEGLQSLIPPLTDQPYLKKNKTVLPCMINYGQKGRISIANRSFDGEMPKNDLAPVEIAEVLTYITNSFGNKMGATTTAAVQNDLGRCR